MNSLVFNNSLKLHKAEHYSAVFKKNKRFRNGIFTVLVRPNQLSTPRIGIVVAKKKVKRAVDRNRIKRVVREMFRCNQQNLPPLDIVVLVNRFTKEMDIEKVRSSIVFLWKAILV